MNKNALIVAIIFASFISGIFGAYTLLILLPDRLSHSQETLNKQVTNIDIKDLESNVTKGVEKVSPSVVSIVIKKDLGIYRSDPLGFFRQQVGTVSRQIGWWTWFFITRDGKIITNKHVVADSNAEYVVITSDEKEHEAKILALDPLSDLAVIQIDSNLTVCYRYRKCSCSVSKFCFVLSYQWEESFYWCWMRSSEWTSSNWCCH